LTSSWHFKEDTFAINVALQSFVFVTAIALYILSNVYEDALTGWMQPASVAYFSFFNASEIFLVSSSGHAPGPFFILLIIITIFMPFSGIRARPAAVCLFISYLSYWVIRSFIFNVGDLSALVLWALYLVFTGTHSEVLLRHQFLTDMRTVHEVVTTRGFAANMLPPDIMSRLHTKETISNTFDNASVLFSDIVGFTKLSSGLKPSHLLGLLNVVFSTFDRLAMHYNVYKTETIGDAYLACSGVVNQRPGNAILLVRCALAMQAAARFFELPTATIELRIGIHTGPLMAGVVGSKMPRYHLFGETVTIAEEQEQAGIKGRVVISGAT
jgi:class 3 adenylate cyclase